jgi:hypothetical protein
MAKVKFSALISEMRNKLNGSVFARNRGGAYLRTKVTPLNPQTAAQVAARSLLASFSQSWRSLTEAQRNAWNSVVDQWATTDVFGDIVNPSGSTLYTRLNINVSLAGGSALVTPPTPVGAESLPDLLVTADASASEILIDSDIFEVPVGHAMVIEATPMLSPGISNAKSKFRVVETAAAGVTMTINIFASYNAKFGGLVVGQKLFVRAKLIVLATGERSQSLVASTIVVA